MLLKECMFYIMFFSFCLENKYKDLNLSFQEYDEISCLVDICFQILQIEAILKEICLVGLNTSR